MDMREGPGGQCLHRGATCHTTGKDFAGEKAEERHPSRVTPNDDRLFGACVSLGRRPESPTPPSRLTLTRVLRAQERWQT